MGCTVFAEGMGFFHKGSGGKGVAPADVCLTPPPPPAGPVPVPYVNSLSAADLADGSKSVTIDGEPTALEDHSYVSSSHGDEAGTQGGNVVTHKTGGKGYFKLWSFTVQVEGKGVARHGDMMGQNCASDPPGCVDASALVAFAKLPWVDQTKPCPEDSYNRKAIQKAPNPKQYAAVAGGPCWQCKPASTVSGRKDPNQFTPDHQPPMNIAWYLGGCHNEEEFKKWANAESTVKPHCAPCSSSQGGTVGPVSGMASAEAQNLIKSWLKVVL